MLAQEIELKTVFVDVSHAKCAEELKGIEEFKSALIANFEAAIDRGIPPHLVMAAVIEFAANEIARLVDPAQ